MGEFGDDERVISSIGCFIRKKIQSCKKLLMLRETRTELNGGFKSRLYKSLIKRYDRTEPSWLGPGVAGLERMVANYCNRDKVGKNDWHQEYSVLIKDRINLVNVTEKG